MQLQLVAVRVEKIVRRAFAFVGFPNRHASRIQPPDKKREILFRNAERVVGVVALLRRGNAPLRVQRQAQPEVAAGKIRAVIPAGVQRHPRQLLIKRHARRQLADRQGQVI